MNSFQELLNTFSENNKERGTQFEGLCKWFLENDPLYRAKLQQVWFWDEWPERWGPDCGIDLIAKDTEGKIWAIQAKCYQPANSVTKKDIDSFLSESTNGKIQNRLLIATTDRIGANAVNVINRQDEIVPVNQLMLSGLLEAPIEWPVSVDDLSTGRVKEKYTPKPYQRTAIDKVVTQLDHRGQLIMACGTGKTLTALWIAEELGSNTTLVLLPSLLLLSKTLTEWLTHCNEPFAYLPVCSDETAARGADSISLSTSELAFPSTTDASEIAAFLDSEGRKVIFSTYQSTPKIAEAFKSKEIAPFDLIIGDEAHRCAGKASSGYALSLYDSNIPATKRLFMTATPRLFQASFKKYAADSGVDVVSMDDEAVFGPVLHKLSFGEAIEQDLLSDYQVVVVGVDNPTYEHMISERRLIETDNQIQSDAQSFASHIGLAKAIQKYDLRRIISFHSRVKAASEFASNLIEVIEWMPAANRPSGEVIANHVSGAMPTSQRNQRLQALGEVKTNQRYVLSNARCLSEGVDVPALDGVAFIDPRNSEIDIIQAVGRAIRLSKNKVVGTIVIPVFINDSADPEEVVSSSVFKKVWAVVNALRSHDDLLGEQLDQLRVQLGRRGTVGKPEKIVFDLPTKITRQFEKALEVRLLETTTAYWEFWYGLLEFYKEKNGHCLVPQSYKTQEGYRLGVWAYHQRQMQANLDESRFSQLDALCFVWDPYSESWRKGFEALRRFQIKTGHCAVPDNFETRSGIKLGKWVGKQRHKKKLLSKKRRESLTDLGFVWDPHAILWETGLNELVEYKKIFGDCNVGRDYETGDGYLLGLWVSNQRSKKKRNVLTQEKIEALDRLEFKWDMRDLKWNLSIEALKKFRRDFGHLKVSGSYETSDGRNLRSWIAHTRKAIDSISPEQMEQLISAGFTFDPHQDSWDRGVANLKSFKRENGHLYVPYEYTSKDSFKLGHWVGTQRRNKSNLSEDRRAQLSDLGFEWSGILEKRNT